MAKPGVIHEACRRCGHDSDHPLRNGPFGFQLLSCSSCGRSIGYPLTAGWRAFWWVLATLTTGGVVGANVTLREGYSWIPAGVGLVSFAVLCVDVGIRRRVDQAAIAGGIAAGSDERSPKRSVAASPLYVATLTLVVATAVGAGVVGSLVVAGLNGSYDTVVEDRPAGAPIAEFTGLDLRPLDGEICGGGEDYWSCTAMHNTMWNSLCTGFDDDRTLIARATCDGLRSFVDRSWERYETCGAGCETRTNDDGRWGYSYYSAVPQTRLVEQPRVTHTETCYFALGSIKIGYCPRE